DAGGSSLRDYVQTSGELGYFQHRWVVYEREGKSCRNCGRACPGIRRILQAGRSTYYCPRHQR
ncbi:MAG: DNA-formamidopyrimidine glycosylase, partial [Dongiaceae bacterium]